jgi:divalent metal cation (Fe/Co/Zn/Cd) transporter
MNLVLSAGKFTVGVSCHSSALIVDVGHSLSDLFSDFVTLYSVQVASLPPDDDHPYGHGKFEAIGSLFLALTLIGTGIGVGAIAPSKIITSYKYGCFCNPPSVIFQSKYTSLSNLASSLQQYAHIMVGLSLLEYYATRPGYYIILPSSICLRVLLACQQLGSTVLRVGTTRQSIKINSILFYIYCLR